MIDKDDGFYPKDAKRLKLFVLLLLIVGFCFFIYKTLFIEFKEYRFTVATVTGRYNNSKSFGVKFNYIVNGDSISGECIDNDCHYVKKGTRCLVKYFVDRPTWNSLYTNIEVPNNVSPPPEGWKEIPKFNNRK